METWSGMAAEAPVELLRAFADPIRRRLIERLVSGPSSAGDLARLLALPRVNVSHHLGVLAAAGLVDLRQRQAAVRPEALTRLRRYFDVALTTAAITLPALARPVANVTQT
ncbi:MAG: helix-turn-helix domain-containing protein [Alphaproteobacteria bacterium]|nr:helix-turn-helix domain-containing protein [Alphaproteobacteria bacterium]MBU1514349.1 helix-turn-helix domain-containing protein [Alphaproteobacteria bacterium]MBU2095993.1 helix-turn-helix domain-containing protein [Alphaproteobacteria bacterium]MBU2153091.1 helix-turn-helix domain-containing protein [Alphaproteobacteria bacterium]MBU2308548.1 helix-turn-helix domain-containing protein [Alphaproteobacteria bacterium]